MPKAGQLLLTLSIQQVPHRPGSLLSCPQGVEPSFEPLCSEPRAVTHILDASWCCQDHFLDLGISPKLHQTPPEAEWGHLHLPSVQRPGVEMDPGVKRAALGLEPVGVAGIRLEGWERGEVGWGRHTLPAAGAMELWLQGKKGSQQPYKW